MSLCDRDGPRPRPALVGALCGAGAGVGTATAAVGALAAPGTALGGLVCAVVIGLSAYLRVRDVADGGPALKAAAARNGGLLVGCLVLVGWLALTGTALLLGSAASIVVLLVALIIAAAWWSRRPRNAGAVARPSRPRELPAVSLPPPPAAMSTAQLCMAWQQTYFALLDLPADGPRAELVHLRAQLLDEIERRDPAGFTRWIDTGARPGSNPGLFMAGDE